MRLFYSPFHTFIHKVLVTVHEAGLWDDMIFVATYPFKNGAGEDQGDAYSIAALNPLDKVPTLALDDGQVVFGLQAVVECLDATEEVGQTFVSDCWSGSMGSREPLGPRRHAVRDDGENGDGRLAQ
jgi:glutathione S-transferase